MAPPVAIHGPCYGGPGDSSDHLRRPWRRGPHAVGAAGLAAALGGGLIPILRVLSASVMSRALIRPFPVPPGAVS